MSRLQKHLAGLALLLILTSLIGWLPLRDTFALAFSNDEYTQILLILPVSIALILLEGRTFRARIAFAPRTGLALFLLAVLAWAAAQLPGAASSPGVPLALAMLALVLSWAGAFALFLGLPAIRACLFPLAFLLALVPLPAYLLDAAIAGLQHGSAWATHLIFALFGIPVVQHGVLVTIPGLTIQVAQECSSIRSSSMLLVTTLTLAQLLLRSPWRRALVVLLSIPLSIARNGLRIFTIGFLGTEVDPSWLTGKLHHQGGIVFFALALVIIVALILWLQTRESRRKPCQAAARPHDSAASGYPVSE